MMSCLKADLRKAGVNQPMSRREKLDVAAAERAEKKRTANELLRSAGQDPRPPRRKGRAVGPLERRFRAAIKREDYERAAVLQDELRKLRGE
jgi:hypothetical protein